MDIAEVANQNSLPPSTLRYYVKRALIYSNERNGLRRLFHHSVMPD